MLCKAFVLCYYIINVVFVLKHLYYLFMCQPTGFKPRKVQFREF